MLIGAHPQLHHPAPGGRYHCGAHLWALCSVDGVAAALSQPVPQAWELREEQETNDAAGEVDLLLNEKLDDANFEAD